MPPPATLTRNTTTSHVLQPAFAPSRHPPGLPFDQRYSPALPRLRLLHPGATRDTAVSGSHVSHCCRGITPASSPAISCIHAHPERVFSGQRLRGARLLISRFNAAWLAIVLMATGLMLLTTMHPHRDATSGLSYAGTHRGCPPWCQSRQVSPCDPAMFPWPHQPTCVVSVRPFRAARTGDFHPFSNGRARRIAAPPVSVSPSPAGSMADRVEEGNFTLQRPSQPRQHD